MRRALCLLGALFLASVGYLPAAAHAAGVSRLADRQIGSYRLFVWTQGDPVRVGRLHVTVAVTGPPDGRTGFADPVSDAHVQVRLESQDGSYPPVDVTATLGDGGNRFYYEADVDVPTTGACRVVVSVQGAQGAGSAQFALQVAPPLPVDVTGIASAALLLLLLMGAAGYLQGRTASTRQRNHDLQRTV